MDYNKKYFGLIDYIIFSVTLVISSIIGIYFGCKKRREAASSAEYLVASRSISWFPIFVSLVVSFFSPVGVMGVTAQIYSTGITFGLHGFSFIIPITMNTMVFAPMFRKLQLISVNEYLERRFSKGVRLLGSFFFIFQNMLHLSIVLYAPSLALETVGNVPKLMTILVTGAICTFYTTLGGMRAVVWTDVFQATIMLVGLVSTAVIGIINAGSFNEIFRIANKYKRLDINFDPDPRSYHTFWGCGIASAFSIMNAWTVSQPTVQRVVAARSLKDAKKALYFSFGGVLLICIVLALDALVIFAAFVDCDPMLSGQIKAPDQILPYFVVTKLGSLQGVPGLFAASLFCFSLSTLSSTLNSMSAIILEDIVKSFQPLIREDRQILVSQLVVCICGAFVTGFAFVVPTIGKFIIKLTIQLFGSIGGPYFAMFAMGVFTRRSNSIGAIIGSVTGFCIGMMLSIGQIFYPPDPQFPPVSMANCPNGTITYSNSTFVYPKSPPDHQNIFADIVSISYVWNGLISVSSSCLVCYIVSICSRKAYGSYEIDSDLTFHFNSSYTIKGCSMVKNEEEVECELLRQHSKDLEQKSMETPATSTVGSDNMQLLEHPKLKEESVL